MENYLWLFAIAGGALFLGMAMAFGAMQRRLTPTEKRNQEQQTKELYKEQQD